MDSDIEDPNFCCDCQDCLDRENEKKTSNKEFEKVRRFIQAHRRKASLRKKVSLISLNYH